MHQLILNDVLPPALLEQVRKVLASAHFNDGKDSATGLARAAKHNLQLPQQEHAALLDAIAQRLFELPELQAFAMPLHVGRPLINRFEPGMAYGLHSDSAYLNGVRGDVAYTLFLEDPASYEGGELQILSRGQTYQFKLSAGSLLLYPCGDLHQVLPVTRGVRHAAVGWIQSQIRDADQRELIAKLKAVPLYIGQEERYRDLAIQTNECIQRLIRMWGN
ncbi:Fe2+-dependent dioxygenase [Pseudomonas sp. MAC6]|uniref:Fe2+-dependent dioxygenase n=1 Tax=Pseudomonas sp. MAC6 TaxID=3401633 RepID=UPI003BF52FCA